MVCWYLLTLTCGTTFPRFWRNQLGAVALSVTSHPCFCNNAADALENTTRILTARPFAATRIRNTAIKTTWNQFIKGKRGKKVSVSVIKWPCFQTVKLKGFRLKPVYAFVLKIKVFFRNLPLQRLQQVSEVFFSSK